MIKNKLANGLQETTKTKDKISFETYLNKPLEPVNLRKCFAESEVHKEEQNINMAS